VLGRTVINRPGMPDFSPKRILFPTRGGFPPIAAEPGARARPGYSPLVRIHGTNIVYNTPIIAVGNGPFDVREHVNTHDRLLGIDLQRRTADLLMVEGFSNAKRILYLSFESSDPITAVIERATFAPALGLSPFPNGDLRRDSARAAIFTFRNGQVAPKSPPGQGLDHVIKVGRNAEEANFENARVLRALAQRDGDAHNVFDVFPTLRNRRLREEYSPLRDLHQGTWTPAAVLRGRSRAQTDGNRIRQLARRGLITDPGGLPLASSRIIINCPALAFTDTPRESSPSAARTTSGLAAPPPSCAAWERGRNASRGGPRVGAPPILLFRTPRETADGESFLEVRRPRRRRGGTAHPRTQRADHRDEPEGGSELPGAVREGAEERRRRATDGRRGQPAGVVLHPCRRAGTVDAGDGGGVHVSGAQLPEVGDEVAQSVSRNPYEVSAISGGWR
jgi:hypothetical protein